MSSKKPVSISLSKIREDRDSSANRKRKHGDDYSSESDNGSTRPFECRKMGKSDDRSDRGSKSSSSGEMDLSKDPKLHKRICTYLTENKDKQYIDIEEMARKLHKAHEQYGRKKYRVFREICETAFNLIMSGAIATDDSSSKGGDSKKKQDDTKADKSSKEGDKKSDTTDKKSATATANKDAPKGPEVVKGASANKMMSNLYGGKGNESADKSQNGHKPDAANKQTPMEVETSSRPETPSGASRGASPGFVTGTGAGASLNAANTMRAGVLPPGTPNAAARRAKKNQVDVVESKVTFNDVGGMSSTLVQVCRLLIHLKHPEVYQKIGVVPPRGFLLHGPPGCGKTLLANAIAGQLKLPLIKLAATEIVSGVSGESESKLRDLFDQAMQTAPCVLFIDEIDAITQRRDNAQKGMEGRIVGQLLACMDNLNSKGNEKEGQVVVVGATNRPDSLDPALRRAGRFEREIAMGIPDAEARLEILKVLTSGLNLEAGFDLKVLAKNSPGYVGADLSSLCRESAIVAVNRIFKDISLSTTNSTTMPSEGPSKSADELAELMAWLEDTNPLSNESLSRVCIQMADFDKALKIVQPSAKREGFATVPDVTWEDIGALGDLREELELSILGPVNHPEVTKALGMEAPTGILLCGPPGCGKTLLAKAVANQAGINFISVKGPELLNMYVGESERAVRQVFQRARNSSPCVIFFDELDALCPRREGGKAGGSNDSSARVVNQLLTEMDGMESRRGVFVMGATNRVDIIDPAVLRPGRLQKILFVDLPSESGREDILKALTKNGTKPRMSADVDLRFVARHPKATSFSGADMSALVTEASVLAFKEHLDAVSGPGRPSGSEGEGDGSDVRVCHKHFASAFDKIRPSVSAADRKRYQAMKRTYGIEGAAAIHPDTYDSDFLEGEPPAKSRKRAASGQETGEDVQRYLAFLNKHHAALPKNVLDHIEPLSKRVEVVARVVDMRNSASQSGESYLQVRRLANSDDEFIEKHNLILPEEIARLLTRRQRRDVCKSILINRPDIPADELFKFKDDLPYIEKFANVLPLDVSKFLFADERRQVVACMLWKKSGWMNGPLREGGEHSVEQSVIDELGKRDPFDFKADQEYIQQHKKVLPIDVAEVMHSDLRRRVVKFVKPFKEFQAWMARGSKSGSDQPASPDEDLASMEIEECPDSRGPSPTPTPEREAEASRFLLQHTDLIPPRLAEIMTASQRANVLGVLLRRRDGIGLEGLSEKSDKYPDIDEWVLNELKSKPDPFKVDKDKKFISAHLDVMPPDVANLMRPNIRRKLVSQLRQSAAASQQTSSQLGDDTVLMPVGGGGDSMDIADSAPVSPPGGPIDDNNIAATGGGLAVKKVGGLTLAAPAKIGLLKPKAFGISLAGFAGGMSDNIVEKPQLTKTLQGGKVLRFLSGMEVRVSDVCKKPEGISGKEAVVIQVAPTGTVLISITESNENVSVSISDLEPDPPDVDEPCKLLVEGETDKLARMKEYIQGNDENVLVQFGDGSIKEVALEQLCRVRV